MGEVKTPHVPNPIQSNFLDTGGVEISTTPRLRIQTQELTLDNGEFRAGSDGAIPGI